MLEAFRKVSNNIFFKILFGLLLLSFAFSGLTGISRMHFMDEYAVKVGSERISQAIIDQKYEDTVRNIRRSGVDFTDEQLTAFGVSKEQIKRMMIQQSLLRQYVDDLGIEAGDDAVTDKIKNIEAFQTNGQFDRAKFTGSIAAQGLSEHQFTNLLRQEIKSNLVIDTVVNNIPLNDYIAGRDAAFNNQKRDVEVAIIPKSFRIPLTEPTEEDLKNYYNENSYRFQIPAKRDLNYIRFEKAKDQKSQYETTVKIEDELAGGSTLKEISEKLKLKLESKKDVLATDPEFSELFLETAFGKTKGQVSDLVLDEKNNEYFVIEIVDAKEPRIPEIAEVKPEVIKAWKESNANEQNLKYIEKMAEELENSGANLQSFAASNGYKYQVLKDIKRSDTEKYGARLVNTAFDADTGDVLGSFENQDGTYKIAKLKEIRQATLTPEEQVAYKTQIADTTKTEIMDQYLEYMRKKYPVKFKETKETSSALPVPAATEKK